MSRRFRTPLALPAALTAVLALLSGPALAQQTPAPATPPAATATAPAAAIPLPKILQDAQLSDVTSKRGKRDDTRIRGKLPDGTEIEAMLDPQGQLRGIRARDEAVLPPALVAQLVPQAVRDNAVYAELGSLHAVFTDERGVMLAGRDAEKNRLHAAFAQDGTLLRFGRGDDAGPGGKDRKWGHDKRHDDRRGGRDHDHGPRGKKGHDDHREGRGPGADAPPPPPVQQGAVIDRGELRSTLTAAGYTSLGEITQDGPRVMAQAVNPQGEQVLVELNPEGRVVREIAR